MPASAITGVGVGRRVWAFGGYPDHGPMHGAKVDIRGDQAGTIVGNKPLLPGLFPSEDLYVVKWDNGQESAHYWQELFCIGQFQTLTDFELAFEKARNAEVRYGPRGAFLEFRATLGGDIAYFLTGGYWPTYWKYVEGLIQRFGIVVKEKTQPEALYLKRQLFAYLEESNPTWEEIENWFVESGRKANTAKRYRDFVAVLEKSGKRTRYKLSAKGRGIALGEKTGHH